MSRRYGLLCMETCSSLRAHMNIVYLLTNKTKTEGPRFYIGSKVEAGIVDVAGVPTIISLKNNKPYYGSSSSQEMLADLKAGHVFEAKILETCIVREDTRTLENWWLKEHLAISSPDYYNNGHAIGMFEPKTDSVVNHLGQTAKEYAGDQSGISKRDGTALKLGFENFGLFARHIATRILAGEQHYDICKSFGLERHYIARMLKGVDLQKMLLENPADYTGVTRQMYAQGVSVHRIATELGIHLATARAAIGEYGKNKNFCASYQRGMTVAELEDQVTKRIVSGAGEREVAKELGLSETMVKRYFVACVRRRLKASDFE